MDSVSRSSCRPLLGLPHFVLIRPALPATLNLPEPYNRTRVLSLIRRSGREHLEPRKAVEHYLYIVRHLLK
jgi:hypothetical protein